MFGFGEIVIGLMFFGPPAIVQGMERGTLPNTIAPKCQVVQQKTNLENVTTDKVVDDGNCR